MLTNDDIKRIALTQSGCDYSCSADDFLKSENVVTISQNTGRQRVYLKLPLECSMVTYGSNIVAQVSDRTKDTVTKYISTYPAEHCFETPHMHILDGKLSEFGLKVCFMAEYFLPDITKLKPLECGYATRVLHQGDFAELYRPEWSNALCERRRHLDMLGVGAFDGDKLIGLAGASADCETMWQIGIDVLPQYRQKGIASALTSALALEVLKLGKVPFYCAAWCNIKSVRNAIRCGFYPAWAELTAKPMEYVDELNEKNTDNN